MPSIPSLFSCMACSSALQVFDPQHDKVVTHLTWQEAARILEAEQQNKLSPVQEGVEVQTPNPGNDQLSPCSGWALPAKRVAPVNHAKTSSESEIGLESISIVDPLEQTRPPSVTTFDLLEQARTPSFTIPGFLEQPEPQNLTILGFLEQMNTSSAAGQTRAAQTVQECNAAGQHPCEDAVAHGGYA